MKALKLITVTAVVMSLAGCQSMPEKVCDAQYSSGGVTYDVSVFGVKSTGNQLQLRAGYPFNFQYVSAGNFTSHNCKKPL